jgi:hypothetical protein
VADVCLASDIHSLSVVPTTPELRKQRDFIEATSRLASYKIFSAPGIPLTPIEIRLAKDKVGLIGRLLASNEDAYSHPDVLLDLVAKLGHRGDKLIEVRTLATIAEAALQVGDYGAAADLCERMVRVVNGLQRGPSRDGSSSSKTATAFEKAAQVAWTNCYQVGRHEEFPDRRRRLELLANALLLCPDSMIGGLLSTYRSVETESLGSTSAVSATSSVKTPLLPSIKTSTPTTTHHPFSSSPISLPSPELATHAARSFGRTASSYFPFRRDNSTSPVPFGAVSGTTAPNTPALSPAPVPTLSPPPRLASPASSLAHTDSSSRSGSTTDLRTRWDLRDKLSDRLTAGVGWLIGANDEDYAGGNDT